MEKEILKNFMMIEYYIKKIKQLKGNDKHAITNK